MFILLFIPQDSLVKLTHKGIPYYNILACTLAGLAARENNSCTRYNCSPHGAYHTMFWSAETVYRLPLSLLEILAPTVIVFVCSSPILLYCLTTPSLCVQQESNCKVVGLCTKIPRHLGSTHGGCWWGRPTIPTLCAHWTQSSLCSVLQNSSPWSVFPWPFGCWWCLNHSLNRLYRSN